MEMRVSKTGGRPVIALAMGDPFGVGPELTARLLSDGDVLDTASLVVFGAAPLLAAGSAVSGARAPIRIVSSHDAAAAAQAGPVLVECGPAPEPQAPRAASEAGGRFACQCFRAALQFAARGEADAVAYLPFNKAAMRLAYPTYDDDIRFVRDVTAHVGAASEFNVLGRLWNARVTSHIPLSAVASRIDGAAILEALALTDVSMRAAGVERPRIAVAALNPHAGDGGNFGREELDIIGPAVCEGARRGIQVEGPFPSDTVFLRAKAGSFDAVLTMYHDQGQIAMKLMGFDRGVTYLGGFPFPICTPAHGTAYDIAGRGDADMGASRAAVLLAARLATRADREAMRRLAS